MLDPRVCEKLAALEVADTAAAMNFRQALVNFFSVGLAVRVRLAGKKSSLVEATVEGIDLDASVRVSLPGGGLYAVHWSDVLPKQIAQEEREGPP